MKKTVLAVIMFMFCLSANAQTVAVPVNDYLAPIKQEIEQAKVDISQLQEAINNRLDIIQRASDKLDRLVVSVEPTDEAIYVEPTDVE